MNPCFLALAVFMCRFILIKSCHLSRSEGRYQSFLELEKCLLRELDCLCGSFEEGCVSFSDGDFVGVLRCWLVGLGVCLVGVFFIPWPVKFGYFCCFYFHQQLCKRSLACHHSSHLPGEGQLARSTKRVKALQNLPWLSVLNYLKLLTSRMA